MEFFFSALVLLSTFCTALLPFFYKNYKSLAKVAIIAAVAILAIYMGIYAEVAFFLALGLTAWRKLPYPDFAALCMASSIVLAHLFFQVFAVWVSPAVVLVAFFAVALLSALGIFGIVEEDLRTFLILSNFVQLTFVVLDLSVANIAAKFGVLTIIQIFNYAIAGTLLFVTLGVLSKNFEKKKIFELRGSFWCSRTNAICATIAALSLAGIPALNIFVAEWYLFIVAYGINPAITVLGIFAALILFIMYFKIAYAVLTGEKVRRVPVPKSITFVNVVLGILCVVLGILPHLQEMILNFALGL